MLLIVLSNEADPDREPMFPPDSEDQRAYLELVDGLNEHQKTQLFATYIDTLAMIEYDKMFIGKRQLLR
jgi:hypothetical protein